MKDQAFPKQQPCPHCQVGLMRIEHQTYFTRIRGEMITVPDFPVWICIICGYQEYDAQAVAWFQQLLDFHDQQLSSTEELSFGHQSYSPVQSAFLTVN